LGPSDNPTTIGQLTIAGDLTINSGSYVADVLGLNNNQVDIVRAHGAANLGGTLDLRASFPARIGDRAVILEAAEIHGRFARVTGIPIANSLLGFAVLYSNQAVSVRATLVGDVNLDNEFNSTDLVHVFQAGHYEDAVADNSTWVEGDWDGDGDFASGDLVVAFQTGAYEVGPVNASAIPEPAGFSLLIMATLAIGRPRSGKRAKVGN
jgi:hypothetical protein